MTALVVVAVAGAVLGLMLGAAGSQPAARHPSAADLRRPAAVPASHALVAFVERTSRDVRSGSALRPALVRALQQCPPHLQSLREQLDRGAPVSDALVRSSPPAHGDTAFVVHGLSVAAHTGGAMADTLDRVADVIRERTAWRAERHAQAAQARLSARMLTVLPLAVAAWGLVSGPRVRQAYIDSPVAAVATGIGVVLNLVGWWWMHRLVGSPEDR